MFAAVAASAVRELRREQSARHEVMAKIRSLESNSIAAAERAQNRIGRELHDGVCQSLAAIDCALACLRRDLSPDQSRQADTALAIQELLKAAIVETRGIARGICPIHIGRDGLPDALAALASGYSRLQPLPIHFRCGGRVEIWDPTVALHLYRIAQEALSNAVRHSQGASVSLEIAHEAGILTMAVRHDGIGVNSYNLPDNGLGLATMRDRALSMNARFEIRRNRPRGTLIRCSLPMP